MEGIGWDGRDRIERDRIGEMGWDGIGWKG